MKTKKNNRLEKLIPKLSLEEEKEMKIFFNIYEKYVDLFAEEAVEKLKNHAEFEKLFQSVSKENMEESRKLSKKLQKDAIANGKWEAYVEYQINQGVMYAKIGLDFKSWYEVVALLRNFMNPYLYRECGSSNDFVHAINGMNTFLDIAMGMIGEAYMNEKQEIIEKEQKEIKKLNKELEKKVKERTAELESSNKELEAFSYSVSHDLRAPLRAINGFSEMLLEDHGDKLGKNGKRFIGIICKNATKMGRLIDDLLAFSKLGRKEIRITKVDMRKLTEEVLKEINSSSTHKAQIKVLKLHDVKADKNLMHQVMFNLVSNAIKYSSKKDNPVVEVSSELKNNEVIVSVKDNGVGFDEKYADKLFGVFQRLHAQEDFEGTGVGLAIVDRIITRHHGKIWAESEVNKGAVFNFSLPLN